MSRIDIIGRNGNDGEHYEEETILLRQSKSMRKRLDLQGGPRKDRAFRYIDLNGNESVINHNSVITDGLLKRMPPHIKGLFLEEE